MGEPLKEKELRELATCQICKEKIGQKQVPILWKVRAERHGLDSHALRRQQGLGMMIGAPLAQVMGPDEDMTKVLADVTCMVCDVCMIERLPELFEKED